MELQFCKVKMKNKTCKLFAQVRVQSDPVGRLVITGLPEQADNPWGITPFKKVIFPSPSVTSD